MSPHEEVITLEELKATACLCNWKVHQPTDAYNFITFAYGTIPFSLVCYGENTHVSLNAPLVPELIPPGLCTLVLTRVLLDKIIDGCTNGKITQRN
jgi:hypothetical protein